MWGARGCWVAAGLPASHTARSAAPRPSEPPAPVRMPLDSGNLAAKTYFRPQGTCPLGPQCSQACSRLWFRSWRARPDPCLRAGPPSPFLRARASSPATPEGLEGDSGGEGSGGPSPWAEPQSRGRQRGAVQGSVGWSGRCCLHVAPNPGSPRVSPATWGLPAPGSRGQGLGLSLSLGPAPLSQGPSGHRAQLAAGTRLVGCRQG